MSSTTQVIVNDHFFNPKPPPTLPFEMQYQERRKASKDPRIMKQVADEAQWEGTVVEVIWKRIKQFAPPNKDWIMGQEEFTSFLASVGITSKYMIQKLGAIYDPKKDGEYNGLVITQLLLLAVTQPPNDVRFVQHCFDKFDRPFGQPHVHREVLNQFLLVQAATGTAKKPKKKSRKAAVAPVTMKSGATIPMVRGMVDLMLKAELAAPGVITVEEFKQEFQDPQNAEFVALFLGPILEAANSIYVPNQPLSLPLLSQRWLKTTKPVPAQLDVIYDADTLLLREIERLGGESAMDALKPKKKGKSAKKKG